MTLKAKYCILKRDGDNEVARKDTYVEAEQFIKDRLSAVDHYILKIWTNSDESADQMAALIKRHYGRIPTVELQDSPVGTS
jgi:hypothetical protein